MVGHCHRPRKSQESEWIVWKKICFFPNPREYKEAWKRSQCALSSEHSYAPSFSRSTYFLPPLPLNLKVPMKLVTREAAKSGRGLSFFLCNFLSRVCTATPYSLPTLSASPRVYCHLSLSALINLATIGKLLLHESSWNSFSMTLLKNLFLQVKVLLERNFFRTSRSTLQSAEWLRDMSESNASFTFSEKDQSMNSSSFGSLTLSNNVFKILFTL